MPALRLPQHRQQTCARRTACTRMITRRGSGEVTQPNLRRCSQHPLSAWPGPVNPQDTRRKLQNRSRQVHSTLALLYTVASCSDSVTDTSSYDAALGAALGSMATSVRFTATQGTVLLGEDLLSCYSGGTNEAGERSGKGTYKYPNRAFQYSGNFESGRKHGARAPLPARHGRAVRGGCVGVVPNAHASYVVQGVGACKSGRTHTTRASSVRARSRGRGSASMQMAVRTRGPLRPASLADPVASRLTSAGRTLETWRTATARVRVSYTAEMALGAPAPFARGRSMASALLSVQMAGSAPARGGKASSTAEGPNSRMTGLFTRCDWQVPPRAPSLPRPLQ